MYFWMKPIEMEEIMQNPSASGDVGRGRPGAGTLTGKVWELADEITREKGRLAKVGEVRERYVAEGGKPHTADTQYYRWKAGGAAAAPDSSADALPRTLRVAPDGRLLIPAEMREAMGLGEGGAVTARVEEGELRLLSRAVAIRQVQARLRRRKRPGESVVDRFLAERRAMWGEA